MKRTFVAAVLVLGLIPASIAGAQASQSTYTGAFDNVEDSKVKAKVAEKDGKLQLRSFTAKHFPVACDGGVEAELTKAYLQGEVKIGNKGGFRAKDDNGSTVFKIVGSLVDGTMTGKFRFFGDMDTGDGGTLNCDSGKLFFVAN